MGPFQVTILGCSSATPTSDRHPTSQYLLANDRHFLIDCGEACQIQLRRFKIRFNKINHIFISHLHGDHIFGLPGLLSSYHLGGRTNELTVYGPHGVQEILDVTFKYSETTLRFPLKIVVVDTSTPSVIYEDKMIVVSTIPLRHRIPCTGYLFREKTALRSIDKEKIEGMDIPLELLPLLKKGQDITLPDGRAVKASEVTIDPPIPRAYAFCSDTCYNEDIIELIKGVDLLYHEATFGEELAKRAKETFHSTARQAASIARMAEVKKMIIGHYSARYTDLSPLLSEARSVFPETYLSEEGEVYDC